MESYGPNNLEVQRFLHNARYGVSDDEWERINLTWEALRKRADHMQELQRVWNEIWKQAYANGLNRVVTEADSSAIRATDSWVAAHVASALVMRYFIDATDFRLVFAPLEIRGYTVAGFTQ